MKHFPVVVITLCLLLVSKTIYAALIPSEHHVTAVFAADLCEELRENGYTEKAKQLESRLNGRVELIVSELTLEQHVKISARRWQ